MQLLQVFILLLAKLVVSRQPNERCGLQKIKIRQLIVHGYDSYPGQFPWHVGLFHQVAKNHSDYVCGGSLISQSYVMTVAHCTRDEDGNQIRAKLLKVVLGIHDKEVFGVNVRQESVYEIHKVPSKGRWTNLRNDIALLELRSRVDYSDYIQPVCLISEEVLDDEIGMVPGWGRTESESISQVLKMARMPIISTIDCLVSNRDDFGAILDSGMICAGYQNGTSVCNGDSGSGLVVERCTSERKCSWFLVGIVSFAAQDRDGYCRSDGYAVFTKVSTYLPWISRFTGLQSSMFSFF